MTDEEPRFGVVDEDLIKLETVYRDDLFSGKTVLVSGGGTGIGKGIAYLMGRLGANVVICGRTEEKLRSSEVWLKKIGAEVDVIPTQYPRTGASGRVDGRHLGKAWSAGSTGEQCGRSISTERHRLQTQRVSRGGGHQSQRHLLYDASGPHNAGGTMGNRA